MICLICQTADTRDLYRWSNDQDSELFVAHIECAEDVGAEPVGDEPVN